MKKLILNILGSLELISALSWVIFENISDTVHTAFSGTVFSGQTAFSGQVFAPPKNPLNAVAEGFRKKSEKKILKL